MGVGQVVHGLGVGGYSLGKGRLYGRWGTGLLQFSVAVRIEIHGFGAG